MGLSTDTTDLETSRKGIQTICLPNPKVDAAIMNSYIIVHQIKSLQQNISVNFLLIW